MELTHQQLGTVQSFIDNLIFDTPIPGPQGPQGPKGEKGDKGDRGNTPIVGIDYPFPRDGQNGESIVGPQGPRGKDGKSVVGPTGKNGSPDKPDDIARKLNMTEESLHTSTIQGLKKWMDETSTAIKNRGATSKRIGGGGDSIVAGTNITIVRSGGRKIISASSGGTSTWSTPVEIVNGSTLVFTVGVPAPTDVVADGSSRFNGIEYNYAAGQITFVPDAVPIKYVKFR